ncbi:MAG TPA: hypothetical protein VF665_02560 [Longimicrobium sp.]|uniref:hypothetical protein n=1 Tax=Longimicrobium sp. TaxID=2029185 RepID=UPI002EDB0842
MKKLSLNLDGLAVQSFTTQSTLRTRGTVQGHEAETDLVSCGGTCDATACYGSCYGCSGGSCGCVTRDITCQASSPNPVGTCCGAEC